MRHRRLTGTPAHRGILCVGEPGSLVGTASRSEPLRVDQANHAHYPPSGLAVESDWRDEALRTNLWLIPAVESAAVVALFAVTLSIDQAAAHGALRLPSWVISGSPDAARQILSSLAGALITVVGVVFSVMIVTLTLASTQFGPRMLRTFIRDRGTQLTLGTFVATFFYAMLTLISIGATFVPHLSVTVALALTAIDLGVLIYFIHHTRHRHPAS